MNILQKKNKCNTKKCRRSVTVSFCLQKIHLFSPEELSCERVSCVYDYNEKKKIN